MNLLIIDDDELIAGYFKRIATKIGGVKVFVASTPIEVDRILKLDEFDCILCDVHMQGSVTGPALLISNKILVGNTVIHLISCSDNIQQYGDEILKHGLNLGRCLRKPVDPRDLLNFLKEHCK